MEFSQGTPKGANIESVLDPIKHAWDVKSSLGDMNISWICKNSTTNFVPEGPPNIQSPTVGVASELRFFSSRAGLTTDSTPKNLLTQKRPSHPFFPNSNQKNQQESPSLGKPKPPVHPSHPKPSLMASLAASVQRSAWLMVSGTYLSLMGFSSPTATSGSPALAPKVPSPGGFGIGNQLVA